MIITPRLSTTVDALLIGNTAPFGPQGRSSAIHKQPHTGPLSITALGFEKDEQADTRIHGGPEKAIHHFPAEHYTTLRQHIQTLPDTLGGFGENISTTGITERDICLGDIFRLGTALVQVSQGRQPCWKLNVRFDQPQMARLIQSTGLTGWYYRVLETGKASAGDSLELIERTCPAAELLRIQHILHHPSPSKDALKNLLELPVLPDNWRKTLQRRLDTGIKEADTARTQTPNGTI